MGRFKRECFLEYFQFSMHLSFLSKYVHEIAENCMLDSV